MNEIRRIRRALGLSQTEFGQRMGGFNQSTVSRWESGDFDDRDLRAARWLLHEETLAQPSNDDQPAAAS